MELLLLLGILALAYAMVSAKRMSALIAGFKFQSGLLFVLTGLEGLYVVAAIVLLLKVILIPFFLFRILKQIKVDEQVGFVVNPMLSLLAGLFLTYLSFIFARNLFSGGELGLIIALAVSFAVMGMGAFIMIFRLKALTQIIGLLVIENGIFLLASTLTGGLPLIVEMAVFLDVFVSVIILGIFVYRINALFTGIDVDQLKGLRG